MELERFWNAGGLTALQEPGRRDRLRALPREVMIRNTRAHIDVRLPRRLAATHVVSPDELEAGVHARLSSDVRAHYADGSRGDRWRLTMRQMQGGSSVAALGDALDRDRPDGPSDSSGLEWDEDLRVLHASVRQIAQPARTRALIDLLRRSDEKTLVFTRFHATLDHPLCDACGIGTSTIALCDERAHLLCAACHRPCETCGRP